MFGVGARFGTLAIAGAILFVAYRLHRSSRKAAKHVGVVGAFLAGLAFLVTFVGDWMTNLDWMGGVAVAGLIVCLCIIVVDWLIDRKADKPAFWAAFALAMFIVAGASNLGAVGDNVGDGWKRVGDQVEKIDNGAGK